MSKHVTPEIGRKLKEVGLEWKLELGDWFVFGKSDDPGVVHFLSSLQHSDNVYFSITNNNWPDGRLMTHDELLKEKGTWLPTLSDLLEWLEKKFCLELTNLKYQGSLETFEWNLGLYKEYGKPDLNNALEFIKEFDASTPEDAAAKAVLWVLEQEKEANDEHNA